MNRNSLVLCCSLICSLLLAASTPALGVVLIGTPPPVGHIVEEVATKTVEAYEHVVLESGTGTVDIVLPLPDFPSSGLPADPSQCMWSCYLAGIMLPSEATGGELDLYALREDNTLHVTVLGEDAWPSGTTFYFRYVITTVAIRTTAPTPVESKSFGEIKAMYR